MSSNYSKKILALLAAKPAISISDLYAEIEPVKSSTDSPRAIGRYALTRSLKGLTEAGFVENHHSGQSAYARLTKEGKKRAHSVKLESGTTLLDPSWDGKWRIILLDLPEDRKNERDALRYLLKKAGFVLLKNSVWISRYPFEHLFTNIKKDLGLSTEMMIITTNAIDIETEHVFLELL